MKEIRTATPTGKEVVVTYDSEFVITVSGQIHSSGDHLSVNRVPVPQLKKEIYPAIGVKSKNFVVIRKEDEELIRSFNSEISEEKAAAKLAAIEEKINGCTELKKAYEYRADQIEISEAYMERVIRTSIGSGDKGDVEGAEKKVNELEAKYPVAKMYIRWSNHNAASSSGYAALQAADALLAGASLEDAQKIAEDWDHFD